MDADVQAVPVHNSADQEIRLALDAKEVVLSGASSRGKLPELLRQIIITAVSGLVFAFLLQITVQNYVVQGDSMLPNVRTGDRVLIDRLAYRFSSPHRGDLVVFRFPYDWYQHNLIKRVIGLPGDVVQVRPGTVLVNGKAVREPYVHMIERYWYGPQRVPAGEYFVLGDNRAVSYDSHQWGFVPASDVFGQVMVTYWPPADFHMYGF
ncbi:MAG: signal peptidase [Chloroflexi bacterium]|nr:signal peptidase [Chloroflexota bacterium]MDB5075893.1 signal peptidase [Chloroflexota bacterium]